MKQKDLSTVRLFQSLCQYSTRNLNSWKLLFNPFSIKHMIIGKLCIADDASTNSEVKSVLQKIFDLDKRVKVTFCKQHGHISVCSNIAAKAASGEFIAFADHDDVIRPHALHYIAKVINDNPSASLIYTDEDKIDDQGIRFSPLFLSRTGTRTFWNLKISSVIYLF